MNVIKSSTPERQKTKVNAKINILISKIVDIATLELLPEWPSVWQSNTAIFSCAGQISQVQSY